LDCRDGIEYRQQWLVFGCEANSMMGAFPESYPGYFGDLRNRTVDLTEFQTSIFLAFLRKPSISTKRLSIS